MGSTYDAAWNLSSDPQHCSGQAQEGGLSLLAASLPSGLVREPVSRSEMSPGFSVEDLFLLPQHVHGSHTQSDVQVG